jgi:hypothetical protein
LLPWLWFVNYLYFKDVVKAPHANQQLKTSKGCTPRAWLRAALLFLICPRRLPGWTMCGCVVCSREAIVDWSCCLRGGIDRLDDVLYSE